MLTIRGCFDSGLGTNVPVGSVTAPTGGANAVSVTLATRWFRVSALNTSSLGDGRDRIFVLRRGLKSAPTTLIWRPGGLQ